MENNHIFGRQINYQWPGSRVVCMLTPSLVGKSTINGHVQLTVLVYQRVNMIVAELAAELLDG